VNLLDKLSDPFVFVPALGLLLALFAVLRKKPETHVQQANHGGVINHHHDDRVSVVVTVERHRE
jgi:hypothetical protein